MEGLAPQTLRRELRPWAPAYFGLNPPSLTNPRIGYRLSLVSVFEQVRKKLNFVGQKNIKNGKIIFACVTEYCASSGTKNSIEHF